MNPSLSVFFPCAGLGTRLQPLTLRIPKPLIPFQGKPALEWNREKITPLNPKQIILNSHHLPDRIKNIVDQWNSKSVGSVKAELTYEPQVLGTGGCLGNLKKQLEQTEYFLVHNGDILHNVDLENFVNKGIASQATCFLAGIHNENVNTLSVAQGKLLGIQNYEGHIHPEKLKESKALTYSGIALYHRSFLDFCDNKSADIKEYWLKAMKAGHSILVEDLSGCEWFDFGNPDDLWKTARWMMEQKGSYAFRYNQVGTEVRPWVSNEAGLKNLPVDLKNMLILEAPSKPDFTGHVHRVIGKDFTWEIKA